MPAGKVPGIATSSVWLSDTPLARVITPKSWTPDGVMMLSGVSSGLMIAFAEA